MRVRLPAMNQTKEWLCWHVEWRMTTTLSRGFHSLVSSYVRSQISDSIIHSSSVGKKWTLTTIYRNATVCSWWYPLRQPVPVLRWCRSTAMISNWQFPPRNISYLFLFIIALLIQSLLGAWFGYYYACSGCERQTKADNFLHPVFPLRKHGWLEESSQLSSNVRLVNLSLRAKTKFRCIKTKTLLKSVSTTICLHESDNDMYVSGAFNGEESIWEEEQVKRMLELLIRHPNLHFIDVGANIGTYTMYAAALGRFVLAIDCFRPNLLRLRRAIQLANVSDRVVVVQNAIYPHSGQTLRLSTNTKNIGGQAISTFVRPYPLSSNLSALNPYRVRTIRFDEVLPILVARGVRRALMKIDIEGSESFVFESGSGVFDAVDIPIVQMEWFQIAQDTARVRVVMSFFERRLYRPVSVICDWLKLDEYQTWPTDVYWLKRNAPNFCWSVSSCLW